MAALTVQPVVVSGVVATSNAVSASDTFANSGRVIIRVANASGSSLTVTIVTTATVETDLAVADRTVTVANGTVKYIGPFPTQTYDTTTTVTFSVTTSVTCEVITY